jgi:SnoaL-like domain
MRRLHAGFATALLMAATVSMAQAPAARPPPDLTPRMNRSADRLASINAQADRLADYDELRNLQQKFGYYFDEALWDQVIDLFTDNAAIEIAQHGQYVGKEGIRKYFHGLTNGRQGLVQGQLNNQYQLSPVITLSADGQTARARWRALIQDGMFGKSANWGAGIYENEYVQQNGIWKISRMHLFVRFYAPYEGGWTRSTPELNARYGKSTAKPDKGWSGQAESGFIAPVHFDNPASPAYRLAPENGATAGAPAPGSARTVAELESQVRAVELKLERLRAASDVEMLQNVYGYYVDKSMQDAVSSLFARNSTLEILGRGVFIGRDRVYEYMRRLGAPTYGTLYNHMPLQPVITVSPDGNSASIRARLVVMFGQLNTGAQFAEGTYENRFIREDGVWKYLSLSGYQTFYTDYEQGWGKHSSAMFSPFPGYPPDMPQTVAYSPYPAVFVAPFHYRNPVSNK